VRERLDPVVSTGAGWDASFVDLDIEIDGCPWLQGTEVYLDPAGGDWTPFRVPTDAVVHLITCIADEATTTRLARGTPLAYRGEL